MTRAVYPGTFDPVTNGHTDLVVRAARLFDEVVVAVAEDTNKATLFTLDERIGMLDTQFSDLHNVKTEGFSGLLVNYCEQQSANVVVRGLRAVSDFEYEFQLAGMNRHLAPDIETVFLTPASQYAFLSSSLVKEVAKLGGNISDFVDQRVAHALAVKYELSMGE